MVKLKADFISDWITYLRERLIQEGWRADEVRGLAERDVPIYFFESHRRRLASRPRLLKIADDFQCPTVDQVGWTALQKKVTKGADLNPHLSERHSNITHFDGLLAEWQVHHFHLGTDFDPKNPQYVTRTGSLVFALVDDNSFCAINVFPHRTHWEEVGIVESIHRNWPDMISKYRVKGVTPETLDKNQRRALRKHNGNVLVGTKDGTVYVPIGGGVVGSGAKMECVMSADKWCIEIQDLQVGFEKQLSELMPTFEQCGYAGEDEIEGQLKITETGYQVFFPKYSVLANLQIRRL
jgi:hypothetical protein